MNKIRYVILMINQWSKILPEYDCAIARFDNTEPVIKLYSQGQQSCWQKINVHKMFLSIEHLMNWEFFYG